MTFVFPPSVAEMAVRNLKREEEPRAFVVREGATVTCSQSLSCSFYHALFQRWIFVSTLWI